jgi:hypothetical protein
MGKLKKLNGKNQALRDALGVNASAFVERPIMAVVSLLIGNSAPMAFLANF